VNHIGWNSRSGDIVPRKTRFRSVRVLFTKNVNNNIAHKSQAIWRWIRNDVSQGFCFWKYISRALTLWDNLVLKSENNDV